MSECSETSRRILPRATESPLDDDNLLAEFLLRLPPLPSSLRRASLVCKRWRRLVSDTHFLRRFRSHHRKAPLLGFVYHDVIRNSIGFISALDSPDHIPTPNFSLLPGQHCRFLDSRHGLVLIVYYNENHVHVWDPVIRDHRSVAIPQVFHDMRVIGGVVFCAVNDQGHVHGACHSYPFKVILVCAYGGRVHCSVYSSETGAWGNTISLPCLRSNMMILSTCPVLIGNSVCWLFGLETIKILQFYLDEQNLAFINVPSNVCDINAYIHDRQDLSIMPMNSGVIHLNVLERCPATVSVWNWMSSGTAAASWMLGNTLELSNLISLRPSGDERPVLMLGSDEDGNVVFKLPDGGAVVVHLGTMQFKKKLAEKLDDSYDYQWHPFTSFYTPGI